LAVWARFCLEVRVSDCAFKVGDKVRFRFCGFEPRESVVTSLWPDNSDVRLIFVADPEAPDSEQDCYPCFASELEVIS
jgi:hypothetical protein